MQNSNAADQDSRSSNPQLPSSSAKRKSIVTKGSHNTDIPGLPEEGHSGRHVTVPAEMGTITFLMGLPLLDFTGCSPGKWPHITQHRKTFNETPYSVITVCTGWEGNKWINYFLEKC